MQRLKMYVGCALTHVTPEERERIKELKAVLRQDPRFEILEFLNFDADNSPRDVYLHDVRTCVGNADLMLAVGDQASTGLGYELGYAIEHRRTPTLLVAHHNSRVTDLVIDIDHPHVEFRRYTSLLDDVPRFLDETIRKYWPEATLAAAN